MTDISKVREALKKEAIESVIEHWRLIAANFSIDATYGTSIAQTEQERILRGCAVALIDGMSDHEARELGAMRGLCESAFAVDHIQALDAQVYAWFNNRH